jgi:teichuronic acid biosynthesis protein TuaE
MKLALLHDRFQAAFFQWGWLTPAMLPLAQLGGRGLFNTLVSLYALWGLLSFWSRRHRLDRPVVLVYVALLGVFLLTIPGTIDPVGGLRTWFRFALQSCVLLLTLAALRESPTHHDRLLNAMALFGALTLSGSYLLLTYHALGWSGQPFDPSVQLREDNLPFLLPFLLGWLWGRSDGYWRSMVMATTVLLVLAYVVLAEGRAALLGLIVGLAIFCGVVLGWRLRWSVLLAALVLVVGIIANTAPFHKSELDPNHPLDAFTAGRTILWQQAIEHPPERAWLGVGIGNGSYAREVLSFEIGGFPVQVKHLHNFLMDTWYETGFLGLGALLTLIGAVFGRLARIWRRLSARDRQCAGVWLAAASALMTAGLLSFSYTSRQLACYLFVCLGSLSHFGWSAKSLYKN